MIYPFLLYQTHNNNSKIRLLLQNITGNLLQVSFKLIIIQFVRMQNSPSLQKKKIALQDFEVRRIIGKGAYGDVFLVSKDNQLFAMKEILKRKLHKQKKQYQAMVERQLLRCMKHPGIVKLRYAFQDKNKLYFVLDYCHLGQFVRFMKEYVDSFNEQIRRFYVAQMVNLLQYLHKNGITHRDMKPQNLLLSKQGNLKLIDFGTSEISECKILSKEFKEQIQKQKCKQQGTEAQEVAQQTPPQPEELMSPRKRRSTFVGTSYYISPQLLEQNICEPPSDLWALGCIIYQLYYLETPFKDTTEYGIFQKIKKVQLEFPHNDLISDDAIDLIKKLLLKNPDQRLGSCSREQLDFEHLKAHPYFNGVSIDAIYDSLAPDFQVKRFTLETEQVKKAKLQEFHTSALKVLSSSETKPTNSQKQTHILVQGLLQKRQFPYYQSCYLRVYSDFSTRMVKMDQPSVIEYGQISNGKTEQKLSRADMIQHSAEKFYIETKQKIKQVFRAEDRNRWVSAINQYKM